MACARSVVLALLIACGRAAQPCAPESSDCADEEDCLWLGAEDRYGCAVPCSVETDCASGESCERLASSCEECDDIRSICE